MKRIYAAFFCFTFSFGAVAQDAVREQGELRPKTFGFGIHLNDFVTANRIRNASLESVFNNDQKAGLSQQAPGISLMYAKGVLPYLDFVTAFSVGSGTVMLENKPGIEQGSGFLALDASVQLKLLPERFIVNPYISAGVGASVTQGYYGAIMPLGAGVRIRIANETYIGLQSQYRVAVTETAGYHFSHGLTIMGTL